MSTLALREEDLPPLTGSALLDPWRIRLRLQLRGELSPPPRRPATRSELVLWEALHGLEMGWQREYSTGLYRLDFFLPETKLAVEVDGGSHFGHAAWARDIERDEWHRLRGIRTLRVSDRDVLDDLAGVLVMIARECEVRELTRALGDQASILADEVVLLAEAAKAVEAELLRLAAACETVLPSFPRRGLWNTLLGRSGEPAKTPDSPESGKGC